MSPYHKYNANPLQVVNIRVIFVLKKLDSHIEMLNLQVIFCKFTIFVGFSYVFYNLFTYLEQKVEIESFLFFFFCIFALLMLIIWRK